jgi:hypothetical protein
VNALTFCLTSLGAGHKTSLLSPQSTTPPPHSTVHFFLSITIQLHTIQPNITCEIVATMNTGTYLSSALPKEDSLDMGHMLVLEEFQTTLDTCVENWRNGNTTVVLSEDIGARYGMALSEYFRNTLIGYVGTPVALTVAMDNGGGRKTFVHMPKRNVTSSLPQVQPTISPLTVTSTQGVLKSGNAMVGTKKAPRPMNCWIIFRDVMHKQLKVKHPELSVQEICKHNHFV